MCMACDWSPYFAAFGKAGTGGRPTRRSVLKGGAAMTAAALTGAPVFQATEVSAQEASAGTGPADYVFRNGPIYTVAGPSLWAKGVAVRGNRIVHVGDEAGAMALAGPNTKVIDLAGKLLMPGFVEGHTHPFLGAFLTSGIDLQVPTLAEAIEAIRAYAKNNPQGP
ncbi:amidohydrolase family protein, partial [Pseudorhodoplanes sp.]|uniref:amidohydrolase family protein n=1 Tax=Pseudorhodoplanes sp. TaxID=1934341 RepID=UPI002B9E1A4B